MDIQLKRGLLGVCVLAAIKSEDSYGYLIRARVRGANGQLGSIEYTILEQPIQHGIDC